MIMLFLSALMEKISIKQRILEAIAAHPKAVTLAISLAVAASLAVVADASHFGQIAFAPGGTCAHCYGGHFNAGRGM